MSLPTTRRPGGHSPRREGRGGAATALALALVFQLAGVAWAEQGVSFRADVEAKRIGLDDQVQLTITIEGRSIDLQGDIELPQLSNLRVVAGPSSSTSFSWVNGAMSQSRSWTLLLQPTQVGSGRIGPVRATISNTVRTTAEITVEIVAGSVLQRGRGADPMDPFGHDPFDSLMTPRRRAVAEPKLFMEASTDHAAVYVGQPVLLTYYLFTQAAVSGLDLAEPPNYAGFWVEELERETEQPRGESVERDGEPYQRFTVLRRLLFPTRAGALEIPATSFKVAVPRGGGFFDPMPRGSAVIVRGTQPIKIVVKPLPGELGASGAVGKLKATTSVDRSALAVGEAVTVRFRVDGTGNHKWLDQAPALSIPGARVYPPQVKPELKVTTRGFVGAKTWEYVVVPETAGPHEVPALPFASLDPQTGQVQRVTTAPVPFFVAAAGAAPGAASSTTAELAHGTTTRPTTLRLRAGLEPQRAPAGGTSSLLLVAVLVLVGHAAMLAAPVLPGLLRRGSPSGHGRSARQALAEIARARRQSASKESAAIAIERAICDVFGELDERPTESDSEQDRELKEILRDVRFIRYAPQLGDYSEKLEEVATRAVAAVRRLA